MSGVLGAYMFEFLVVYVVEEALSHIMLANSITTASSFHHSPKKNIPAGCSMFFLKIFYAFTKFPVHLFNNTHDLRPL